ncbi:MAG: homoserine dehydrogenase [Candidatus Omnitrophica bacterium]|nr:homoserine dehydrogenase [Candidatus Omnitrophota bacterium]
MNQIRVGVAGCGTVGTQFIKILQGRRTALWEETGLWFDLAGVADIDRRKAALVRGRFFSDAYQLVKNPEVNIFVELIGGLNPAYGLVKEALSQGKSVITANKALLSEYGEELMSLAETNRVYLGFEASVGGAIPIIKTARESFVGTSIQRMLGILNGTTNYILSRMTLEKMSFSAALEMARKRGYAEADPALDLSGTDTTHKLGILVRYLFRKTVPWRRIPVEGIETVEPMDIQYAQELGYRIKLLAVADARSGSLDIRVHPTLLPANHLLALVEDVYNAIYLEGDLIGQSLLFGEGAGGKAAASAVLADVVEVGLKLRQGGYASFRWRENDKLKIMEPSASVSRCYLRFTAVDRPGVLAKIAHILGSYNISIASVIQKQENPRKAVPIIVLTHHSQEEAFQKALARINRLEVIYRPTIRFRLVE